MGQQFIQMEAVAEALSSGVAWDDLGELKPEARKLKWNKSSWGRSLPSPTVPQIGEAPPATTSENVQASTWAYTHGVQALPPTWLSQGAEAPAALKDMGGWTARVYTAEQQARLGVDEEGTKVPDTNSSIPEPDHEVLDPHTFDASPTLQQLNRHGNSSFHIGGVAMRGRRPTMEDTHRVTLRLSDTHADTAFFGVFDGHGGDQVSQEVARDLHKAVGALPDLSDASLQRASLEFDARFNKCFYCGSCSVFALVQPAVDGTHEVVVVNLGDSRAMLVHADGTKTDLSTDHKPDDPAEAARIRNAGGHVRYGRVDSNLAVSRAFGDSNYKSEHSLGPTDQKVIALPDIVRVRAAVTDKLLLICDGVVECMTNKQVAEIVHKSAHASDPAMVVSELVYHSMYQGSGDNHSAMLVLFKDGTECGRADELLDQ